MIVYLLHLILSSSATFALPLKPFGRSALAAHIDALADAPLGQEAITLAAGIQTPVIDGERVTRELKEHLAPLGDSRRSIVRSSATTGFGQFS